MRYLKVLKAKIDPPNVNERTRLQLEDSSLEIEREDFELHFDLGVLDSLLYLSSTSESVS
jgi:hypothetical protein